MYKVIWKNTGTDTCTKEFNDLAPALDWAKELEKFVTIQGNNMEVVGIFGADSIKNGVCPDGIAYDWKKRRTT